MRIKRITRLEEKMPTYDFEVKTHHHYFLGNGCASHNTGGLCNATASCLPVYSKEMFQTFAEFTVPVLPKYVKDRYWYYKTKWQYTPEETISYVRSIQKWIDTGISMEININPALTNIKKISDAVIAGFLNKQLKAVYYSMTIGDDKDDNCTDCAN